MTIKQLGGVFGRNPTFSDVNAESLTLTDATPQMQFVDAANTDRVAEINFPFGHIDIEADINDERGSSRITFRIDGSEVGRWNSDGNLVIANSGNGIDFSATAGAGTSELFNDYEEGESGALTMTPQTSGTITLNASYDTFKYTKIGNRVTISGQFLVSSVSSPVGAKVTLPIPFTSVSGQSKRSGTAAYYYTGGGVETLIPCGVAESATDLSIHLDASTIVAGHEFWFDVTYQAA